MALRKALIIRFSSIGDIVLTTPVMRCLKNRYPDLSIHFVTKKAFAPIVKANPYVDRVYEFDENLDELVQTMKPEAYDLVIDLHHNLRSLHLKRKLGVTSVAFDKLNIEKWLLVNLKWNRMPAKHIVDRYLETVAAYGVAYDGNGLDFFIPSGEEISMQTMPQPWRQGYVALVVGAKHETKKLPASKWSALIAGTNRPAVVLGGPEDAELGRWLEEQHPGVALNRCGALTLMQSASLVRQATCVLTNDTGLMHIAAAFKQRIISFWGNTVPEFGMVPLLPEGQGESLLMEVDDLNCRPCSKIGYSKCPKQHFRCMMDQDLKQVVEKVQHWF